MSCLSSAERALGVVEIADRSFLPLTTTLRITSALADLGYLERCGSLDTYHLGLGALTKGIARFDLASVRVLAAPVMLKLAEETGTCISLAVRHQLSMVCLEVQKGSSAVSLNIETGTLLPITTTALGRAYLSVCSESARDRLLRELQDQYEANWPVEELAIARSLNVGMILGACYSLREWSNDVISVAAGLRLAHCLPLMALGCSAPAAALSESELMCRIRPRLLKSVQELRKRLSLPGEDRQDSGEEGHK